MGPAVGIPNFSSQPLVKIAEAKDFAPSLRILSYKLHILCELHHDDQVGAMNKIEGDRLGNMHRQ